MGVLDPPPQRTGGCGGPRPRCSAASPPQRRPKPQPCLSRECVSSRSAAEAVPASDTERETALDGRRIEPNHGRNRPLTPTYGRAALKCSAAPAAEQSRRSTFGRRAASMAHTSRLLERSGPNDHQMEAKRSPFRTHHGTALSPPAQALQVSPGRSPQPAQTGRNGRRLLRNGSIIADIIMSSSIALQACLGRCVWPPPLWPRG